MGQKSSLLQLSQSVSWALMPDRPIPNVGPYLQLGQFQLLFDGVHLREADRRRRYGDNKRYGRYYVGLSVVRVFGTTGWVN